MNDAPQGPDVPSDDQRRCPPPAEELVRFTTSGTALDSGAACLLLVVRRTDGWALSGLDAPLSGLDAPGRGLLVRHNSMVILAQQVLAAHADAT